MGTAPDGKKFPLETDLSRGQVYRPAQNGYLPRIDEPPSSPQRRNPSPRSLPAFSNFLSIAALSDTELINYSAIARKCSISSPAVNAYFQILEDTLQGHYVPAYTKRPKRRVLQSPKFYFADVGVVNWLTKRGRLEPGTELFGKAFENYICHELTAHAAYSELFYEIRYWRLASGIEVDFILENIECAIEVKGTARISSHHLRGLRELYKEHPQVKRRIVVCLVPRARKTEDGIEILPVTAFLSQLWANEIIS